MIITEKQLLCLIAVLKDSITSIYCADFSVSHEQRQELLQIIYNQQSDKLIDIYDKNLHDTDWSLKWLCPDCGKEECFANSKCINKPKI